MNTAVSVLEWIIAFGVITNMFLQAYDILWCRWHHCGKSSKNSTEPRKDDEHTIS